MKKLLICLLLGIDTIQLNAQQVTYKGEAKDLSFVKINPTVAIYDIAALEAANALEMNIVGVSSIPDHLPNIRNKEIANIGGLTKPDLKALEELQPELIIISGRQRGKLDSLSQIAPVLQLGIDTKDYLNSLYNQVNTLGKIAGKEKKADHIVKELQNSIAQYQAQSKTITNNDAIMMMFMNGKYLGFPSQSRFGFIYDVLGFKESSIQMDASARSNPLTDEQILVADPTYLFIFDRSNLQGDKLAGKSTIETEKIKQTKAYKNGNIIYLTPSLWYLIGGGVNATELMAKEVLNIQ